MILKTVLLLLFLDTLLRIIFKVKNNTLNCGIFAWVGKNPSKFNKGKFDVLGIFNEKRGTDSCGVSIDGEIYTGTYKNKVYKDFISNVGYNLPKNIPTVLGHTRWATTGTHNEYNAHPFGFGEHNDMFEFIGVHNGSLLNENVFSKARNIPESTTYSAHNGVSKYRKKIDSELLLESLYQDDNFSVLSEYNGAAALIFTNLKKPNTVYFYHGMSKKYYDDKNSEEERPLYYYKETRNSLYVSSMEESLIAIGGTDKTIGEFKHNTVYEITDGDISKAKLYKIDRSKNYQKDYVHSTYNHYNTCNFHLPEHKSQTNSSSYPSTHNIYNETIDSKQAGGKIYFSMLRYFRTGHPITGCYIWIKDYGFYFLDKSPKQAEEDFWRFVNKPFYNGQFLSENSAHKNNAYYPLIHNSEKEITEVPLQYFFEGVWLLDSLDYAACVNRKKKGLEFTYDQLSMCSRHPIIDINKQYKSSNKQGILLNSDPFTGSICPLGSEYIYQIDNGNLIKKKKSENKLKVMSLKEAFDDVEKKEKEEKKSRVIDNKLDDLAEEIFGDFYAKIPLHIKSLKKYESNDRGKEMLDILEYIKECISELLVIEKQD